MRYLHTNADGSIGLWSVMPKTIVRKADGAAFKVLGVRRRNGQCLLYGGWVNGSGGEFVVGPDDFDVGEIKEDQIEGHTIVFWSFDEGIRAKLHADNAAKVTGHRIVTKAEIPTDYSFRGAWKDTGSAIEFDMQKAREIHRGRLRALRDPLMAELDAAYLKADEDNRPADKKAIGLKKQALRDITADPRIDAARTVDDLKAVTVE